MLVLATEAVTEAEPARGEEVALILVGALLLALLHVVVRPLRRQLLRSELFADSAIAGLSTAYVFVVLLPELETGHEIIGDYVFVIVLCGFVLLFGLEHAMHRLDAKHGSSAAAGRVFALRTGVQWSTGFLFLLTWPNALHERPTFFLLAGAGPALGLALHGYQLSERDPDRHHRWARWVLATGPLAGAAVDIIWHEANEVVLDVMIAFLAGFILFGTITDESYEHERTRFAPFVAGASFYVAIFLTQPLHPGG